MFLLRKIKRQFKNIKIFLFIISIIIIFLFSFSVPVFLFPGEISAGEWIKAEIPSEGKIWVDTSHWETKRILVSDGYYKNITNKRWIDTSHTVKQGYWATGEHKVWVESKTYKAYTKYKYIDTSHSETEYYYVDVYRPVKFTAIKGTDSYGWSVYSFAAKSKGTKQVTYNGEKYLANIYVIDYKPARGGRIYAVKYVFIYKIVKEKRSRTKWVKSGYWKPYTEYKLVDNSHWETRTERYWVDTSYRVESGYWEEYTEKKWVDTSYYDYKKTWVSSGYYAEPIHGKVIVEKTPEYIFTRWHKSGDDSICGMDLKVSWIIDNSDLDSGSGEDPGEEQSLKKISKVYIFQNICRYKDNPVEKVDLYSKNIEPCESGSIELFSTFDFAGSEESLCHIYLFTEEGESVHVYFSNPVNGFKSINIDNDGTSKDADIWLGGQSSGEIIF